MASAVLLRVLPSALAGPRTLSDQIANLSSGILLVRRKARYAPAAIYFLQTDLADMRAVVSCS